ncbi:MAG TPA: RidA family protein [Chitinophagaceae bacterium]|nr:RidA family protein [Chitinophagaceae bacterium]
MSKKAIVTKKAPSPIGPYSQAILAGDMLFISGQICIDPETGELKNESIRTETHQVMKNILAILNEAEMGFANIVKTSIFITDMNRFAEVNEVYGKYFESGSSGNHLAFPARETVQVAALPKFVNVEISAIAVK